MSADLATLAIVVDADKATADVTQFGRASLQTAEQTGILEQSVGHLETAMAKIRVLFGLGLFGFKFLQETIEAQNAMAQLEAGVRSTGMAAGFTAGQLAEQAAALQKVSTFSDETIMKAQGVLLIFERISGVNFQRATQAAIDLATRMGTDVPEAARTLGRALEDPAQGLTMLRRAGITFTEGQKDMLVTLVQTGHAAEAQTKILDLLQQRLGGSAMAARDTLGGALKALAHDFGDLFEVTRAGSSPLITAINAIDTGINFLKEHGEALINVMEALAITWVSKNVAALNAYIVAQIAAFRASVAAKAAAAEEAVIITAKAIATQEATTFERQLAEAVLFNATCNEQCAFAEEERIATVNALTIAQGRLVAATEAEEAATVALAEAQIVEVGATVAATASTTAFGVVMAGVTSVAEAMWTAIGGPIGLVLIGLFAVYEAWKKIRDMILSAKTAQTSALNSDPALEKSIAAQNAQIAAAQRLRDDQADALIAAQKADAERDAQTAKINALNAVYDRSALALKIYGIELDANIEKVKAHKNVVQAEWATIDASIDAMTRAQVAAARLDFAKQAASDLRDLKAENTAMIQNAQDAGAMADAQAAVAVAQQISTRAGIDAQVALDHLNVKLQENAKLVAAKVAMDKASFHATQEEIDAARAIYDETVRGIEAERQIRDATIDRVRAIDDLTSAMTDFGNLLDMISGKSKASIESIIEVVKRLADTIQALSKNSSLQDAISVVMGGKPSGASGATSAATGAMSTVGKVAAGAGQVVGMLGAGFTIGQTIGGSTTNATLGIAGGTLGGAAAGAAMGAAGGPIGMIAGGIIGAGAGLIGSLVGLHKSAADAAKALQAMQLGQTQVAASLADWRAQITGTAADQLKASTLDLKLKYLQMLQTIESTEAGKKQEDQRNKDLKEAADLYAEAQKHLTDTTNTLNNAFTGMINAVTGYKLNLQLFNFSPSLGPSGTGSTGSGSGSGGGGGGGSGGTDGGTSVDSTPMFVVQMAVDGKVLAQSTVRYARKVAQANFGSSDKLVDALQVI